MESQARKYFRIYLSLLSFLFRPLYNIILALIYPTSRKQIPPIENDLLLVPATELADRIRWKKLKSFDLVQAYINRILAVNPHVNSITDNRFGDALDESKALDKSIREDGQSYPKDKYPFLGVPFTAKESIAMKGLVHASGVVHRKDIRATNNAPVIDMMIQAGGIPVGLTNVSEACMWWESANRLYGRSRNPYDLSRIVGGSSGGEAALLSAAGSVIGIGSDIGGSLRIPSFMNGIFCHKPTAGIVPNAGQFPDAVDKQALLLVTGPMCRYIADVGPMFRVLAGKNIDKVIPLKTTDYRSIKYYYMQDDGGSLFASNVAPELKKKHLEVVNFFERTHGVTVERVTLPKMKYSLEMWTALMESSTKSPSFASIIGKKGEPVSPGKELFNWMLGRSVHTLPSIGLVMLEERKMSKDKSDRYLNMLDAFREELSKMLDDDGVLFFPTMPRCAPRHNEPLTRIFDYIYSGIFNALGLPSTHCPLGLSPGGLPTGIQIISKQYNDWLPIHVAEELSRAFGGWVIP